MMAERERLAELAEQLERGAVATRPPLPAASEILEFTRRQLAALDALVEVYEADPMPRRRLN